MTPSRLCLVTFVAVVPALVGPFGPIPNSLQPQTTVIEELIAEKDPGSPVEDKEDVASPDGRKIAWRVPAGQKWSVALNGARQGGTYDDVRALTFSRDGRHLAFAAKSSGRWMVVLDGVASTAVYDEVGDPSFDVTGGRLAYTAKRSNRWVVVENGKEGPSTYSDADLLSYSDDGQHIAFRAKAAKKWTLMVDGQSRGGEFDEIVGARFSPDGSRVAHVGRRGGKYIAVVDGKEGKPFDIIGGMRFGADSRRFAYAGVDVHRGFGNEKGVGRAITDDQESREYEGMQIGSLWKNMATGSTPHLLVGYFGQLLTGTHGITAPVFSPDGKRVAYAARGSNDETIIVVDGESKATFPSVLAGPVFSPDSQRIALVVAENGALSLVVDDAKVGPASTIQTDFIVDLMFSPDNRRVAYIGVNGGDWYDRGYTVRARRRVYVDGEPGTEYDVPFLGGLQFTTESYHFVYVVGRLSEGSRHVSFVVVDGTEGKRYDDIFGAPRFENDGVLSYTAQAGRKFFKVSQRLGTQPPTL